MQSFLSRLWNPQSNCAEAAVILIEILNLKISSENLVSSIEQHPDYPSLLSISDVFLNYGIDNITASFNATTFSCVNPPFITTIRGENHSINYFTVVKGIDSNLGSLSYYDREKSKWIKTNKDVFFKRCSGYILMCDVAGEIKDNEYYISEKKRSLKNRLITLAGTSAPLFLCFLFLNAYLQQGPKALFAIVFSFFSLIGAVICGLIVWHELDHHNPILKSICKVNSKSNCELVLSSRASKIWGVSWSSIGLTYFAGSLLLFVTNGFTNSQSLFILACLNVLALPYTVFSIFYQWRVIKKWCVLCIAVQATLFFQAIVTLSGGWLQIVIPIGSSAIDLAGSVLATYMITFSIIYTSSKAFKSLKESRLNSNQLQRFKNKPKVFEAILQQSITNILPSDGLGVLLGNPHATNKIIKVCSLYCSPCANALYPIEHLLKNYDDLQVQIIFNSNYADDDRRNLPAKHLLAIADECDQSTFKKAMAEWYIGDKTNYNRLLEKYPITVSRDHERKIGEMKIWCKQSSILHTPTFYVNGYLLPQMYNVNDLKYCLLFKNG